METKNVFYNGDELQVISQEKTTFFDIVVQVEKTSPLSVEILTPIDENLLDRLQKVKSVVVAYAKRGYAYKARISSVNGEKMVLSLMERHEMREYFRVDTVISMGYEITHQAPRAVINLPEGESATANFPKVESGQDPSMAQLMQLLYSEIRMLRQEVQKSSETDTTKLESRLVSLSGSGISFTAQGEMQKGDVLRLTMMLGTQNRPITCQAKVIRVETEFSSGSGPALSVACRFRDISDADREQIIRYVFQTQRHMLLGKWKQPPVKI